MDENRSSTGDGPSVTTQDPSAGLDQIRGFLKAKDDTSRFVGLALLKSVLDTQAQLREDVVQVNSIWESISPKFLDRLLRVAKSDHVTADEARNMIDIAVGVLHTFAIILPEESREDKRFIGRIDPLVNCLGQSSPESTVLVLQTLLTLASCTIGASQILQVKDVTPLTELATQQPLVLDVIGLSWSNASTAKSNQNIVSSSIDDIMPKLIVAFKDTDAVTLLAFTADTFSKVPPEVLRTDPSWLEGLIILLKKLVTSRPTATGRAAYIEAAATLLQVFQQSCPGRLFRDDTQRDATAKPFSYLLVNLILIDIRSSFPTLLSKLNSSDYPSTARRLAGGFDVISGFIGFLVRSLDDIDEENGSSTLTTSPDLLLKLRKDIAETMSLAIEYMRDRWDASVAGVSGLHPEARTGTSATSEGTRLTLTWASMKDNITDDPLILASIRTLAIWLREDENENMRSESAGLTDMFIELYKTPSSKSLDFKYPILTALEATLTTEGGIDGFLSHDAWAVLKEDLESIVRYTTAEPAGNVNSEASRGIEIIRVLLAVVDDTAVTEPHEHWMRIAETAASMKPGPKLIAPWAMELKIAMIQLAAALLHKASPGMRRRYRPTAVALSGLSQALQTQLKDGKNLMPQDFQDSIDDVVLELANLD
ncbi:hypothetical protein GMDG_06698 [Pseudogymnoascus destructans 20631-21]|uniref:DUF1941 family protein n=2 Tax=Pseudogymnoascus destructans TaxID=655981 RepID=L8FUU0_PSED2|nr:hypothetical protein GMDG_06698 [Pseudogymnoascus destructans 20631-21]